MRLSAPSLHYLSAMSQRRSKIRGRDIVNAMSWNRVQRASFSDSGDERVTGDEHFQSVKELNDNLRDNEREDDHRLSTKDHPGKLRGNAQLSFHNNRVVRPRRWDHRAWKFSNFAPSSERFVVLSYNILADVLGTEHRDKLYRHIPPYMMDWEWRKKSILFELNLWSPDIMCLQEVDRFEDFEDSLNQRGYSGIWTMRTGTATDGCAIFWRNSKFRLIQKESVHFNEFALRDNVAQICVFELNQPTPASSDVCNKVLVCNIHVLYNPKRGDIKLGQVRLLLEKAQALSTLWNNAPIVICGDFNCTPKSPLYNFIADQKLSLCGVDRDMVSGQGSATVLYPRLHLAHPLNAKHEHASDSNTDTDADTAVIQPCLWTPEEIATATGGEYSTSLQHSLPLISTYPEVEDTSGTRDVYGEPLATSCNRCFFGTVDYIWRSEGLQTVKVLTTLTKESMKQTGGFPTKKWGSDHVALVSELALTDFRKRD